MTARSWADVLIPASESFIRFTAVGEPAPQGSKRHVGNGVMLESSKNVKPWRATVAAAAIVAARDAGWAAPVAARVDVTFWFRRPKSHYRTGRFADELRPDAPTFHTNKPDGDKLIRAVFDALASAGVVRDDCSIAQHHVEKLWAPRGAFLGADITVSVAS